MGKGPRKHFSSKSVHRVSSYAFQTSNRASFGALGLLTAVVELSGRTHISTGFFQYKAD